MDAINAIFTRRSTREFTEQPIESEKLHQILDAAMSGPCCVNARDWSFVVVTEKEKLWQMAAANGEPARPLKTPLLEFSSVVTWSELFRLPRTTGSWMGRLPPKTSASAPTRWGSVRYGSAHGHRWIGCSANGSFLTCLIL